MKSESRSHATKQQTQDSAATTSTQDHAKANLEPAMATGRNAESGHFRRWWNEYQKKSAFQGTPLKLQTQSGQ